MKNQTIALLIGAVLINFPAVTLASGAGASGGLSLLSIGNARAAALGQAYTASFDDVAGMEYNPASLGTLKSGQASLLYQQGLIQDSYGHFIIGTPKGANSALGFSFGYYNGGKIDLTNAAGNTESVNAQTDLTGGVGYAHKFGGLSLGFSGKFLQSKLIEQVSATAYAADAGFMLPVNSRIRIGGAALNYGTQLKYEEAGDNLPRMLRIGAAFLLAPGRSNTTLLLDAPYMVNEKITTPSVGLETLVGPLALRAGYRSGGGVQELTMGAGFTLGRSSLDYAFGLINQLDAQHKVSLSMKFGGPSTPAFIARKPVSENSSRVASQPALQQPERRYTLAGDQTLSSPVRQHRVYLVKEGDTLASIAQSELGDKRQWQAIYTANKHLIDDPAKIEKGMRIIIP